MFGLNERTIVWSFESCQYALGNAKSQLERYFLNKHILLLGCFDNSCIILCDLIFVPVEVFFIDTDRPTLWLWLALQIFEWYHVF